MKRARVAIAARDLAAAVVLEVRGWPGSALGLLGQGAAEAAVELSVALDLAVARPTTRRRHLDAADEALVRLRVHLAVASEVGLSPPATAQRLADAAARVGRQIGGWKNKTRADAKGPTA